MSASDLAAHPRTTKTIAAGLLTIALGIGGFTAWAATAPLASAALAPGLIGVESNRKTVQHVKGGIIAELLVREGERVADRSWSGSTMSRHGPSSRCSTPSTPPCWPRRRAC